MALTQDEIRAAAEADLEIFITLVAPHLVLGEAHRELIRWWTSSVRKDNVLVLLPRAHLKSKLMAYKTAWELTRDPTDTVLYVSATIALAEKQLHLIKLVLDSRIYRKYWPEMTHPDEGKREKWTTTEISVDHPRRAEEGIRDPSVKAAGLKTNITGFHATRIKLDDVVVPTNAYTEEGRTTVANAISQIASIREPGSFMDCAGTRYHPNDQYKIFLEESHKVYDEDTGEELEEQMSWDSYMKEVEKDGEFLWPLTRRMDGKKYGFSLNILAKIKAAYTDRSQFYAQYYNNPNDPDTMKIDRAKFQYYDRTKLQQMNGKWTIHGQPLNIFAGIDFAFSLAKKADYTSLVVIGVDPDWKIYLLEIKRFKSNRIKDYFQAILETHQRWDYRKIRAEVTTAQKVIVRDLKGSYIVPQGLNLMVDEYSPNRNDGRKEERISATLEPKYDNLQMWHYQGGEIADLEEELVLLNPPHDDIKDALTAAVDIAVAPRAFRSADKARSNLVTHVRFGGIAR